MDEVPCPSGTGCVPGTPITSYAPCSPRPSGRIATVYGLIQMFGSQLLNLAGGLHQGAVGLQVIPIILPPLHRFSVWHCDFVTHKEVDFDVEPWLMKEGKNTGLIEFS
jgi:hypothetical protein